MFQELFASLVHIGQRRILFERTLALYFSGEVVARVEELEEAADGIGFFVGELDLSRLCR